MRRITLTYGFIFLILFFGTVGDVLAQVELGRGSSMRFYGGPVLRTYGYGVTAGFRNINTKHTRTWQFDLVTHKHPREIKIINPNVQNPRPYVYGKLYRTAFMRFNTGYELPLIRRNDWNRLGVYLQAQGGITTAIQRPVYLSIYHRNGNDNSGFIRSERYDPNVHTRQEDILGYADDQAGWGELEYRLGLNLRAAVDLQWASDNGGFKSLRVGGIIDYFPGGLPMMALTENPKAPATLYVAFIWGR